ncbi:MULTISPECIES: acyl-CoA dehydrogenase [Alteromonadales]|jgi:alkylation response protein AidB-like acyl-CoA dehydrogenase|uniref:3-methylmercaptopropionyl-CoA dehydrogenase n=3 Tax=Alteromonadaceae TaxID=72275 RepID=A0AAC9ADE4_9ALTE|nr:MULTISPECIES: acyl-CoA dehydrogenase [Alteromonadaceae]MCG8497878.1 acyl-CoA dehydrogenase [Enterobacterales bacterium]MCP3861729.1 acyl-CoA dehydrogenase [Aestuariibacter sp.]AFV85944.1 acyl-CoA dehydrogenase domain-containing protein [Alteromonas mediterranea DE1]AGP82274.1 acyl-CoA dehydrogenase domain-containing protein [Alteromonas mediterranea MED64]AGP97955.1 acyl-CoA dehydrogenase domain-containing protein [Alteromonas mediterranea UM7]|tara:strand:+ start:716 stop:2497 length:1782 start_codon:yes stop_codon:yes gene_type:complete
MSQYQPPVLDAKFVLDQLIGFDGLCEKLQLEDINIDLADAVLEEAGKLSSEVFAPLNWDTDQNPAQWADNAVTESPGLKEAYQQFVDNGWSTLTAPEEFGGQNLPQVLGTAVSEMWQASNMAFALCPLLSIGSVEALLAHGSDELKALYLPRLIAGEWTGTMNLTEPGAGSDLAAVSTTATPDGDHYRIKGQKIFITWGDHQMTPNIVHLVLARLPDAPPGVKGISLFIVPKFVLDENGEPGERNDVYPISIEHKLGIHGSPTCTMAFGDNEGAIGYLVGEPHKGLPYMFTMMNHARQGVGVQGLGISDRAYQQAVQYARERVQGKNRDGSKKPIIEYPDVRRMLLTMRSGVEAMRALALEASAALDFAHADNNSKEKYARLELFTPIVKGWMTEFAQELTSLNIQVHGGMGYVEETGAAQHFRDARILPIYEGTTAIQALDLIGRKVLMDGGVALESLLNDMTATATELSASSNADAQAFGAAFAQAVDKARAAKEWLLTNAPSEKELSQAVCFDMLMAMGYLCGGWMQGRTLLAVIALTDANDDVYGEEFLAKKRISAMYYSQCLLPRALHHFGVMVQNPQALYEFAVDQF